MAASLSSVSSAFRIVGGSASAKDDTSSWQTDLACRKLYESLISANPPTEGAEAARIAERMFTFLQQQRAIEPPKTATYSNDLPTLVRSLLAPERKFDHPDFEDTMTLCHGLLEDLGKSIEGQGQQNLGSEGLTPVVLKSLRQEMNLKRLLAECELAKSRRSCGQEGSSEQLLLEDLKKALIELERDSQPLINLRLPLTVLKDLQREIKCRETNVDFELAGLNPHFEGSVHDMHDSGELPSFSPQKTGSGNPFAKMKQDLTGRSSSGDLGLPSPCNTRPVSNPRPGSARPGSTDPHRGMGHREP